MPTLISTSTRLKADKPDWGARKIRELLVRTFDGDVKIPPKGTSMRFLIITIWSSAAAGRATARGTSLSAGASPNDLWCAALEREFKRGNGR